MQLSNLTFGRLLPDEFGEDFFVFDLTEENRELWEVDLADVRDFNNYIQRKLRDSNCRWGIGRYNEDRSIYRHSQLFSTARSIHLGIDLWVEAGTPVLCPFDGRVHSFQNNEGEGDYGPTIILEHNVDGQRFYTLYGHLSLGSIQRLQVGQTIVRGDRVGDVGNFPINGNWPAHLHFQIITDLKGKRGDFPGVAGREDREHFLEICPDPNIVLKLRNL